MILLHRKMRISLLKQKIFMKHIWMLGNQYASFHVFTFQGNKTDVSQKPKYVYPHLSFIWYATEAHGTTLSTSTKNHKHNCKQKPMTTDHGDRNPDGWEPKQLLLACHRVCEIPWPHYLQTKLSRNSQWLTWLFLKQQNLKCNLSVLQVGQVLSQRLNLQLKLKLIHIWQTHPHNFLLSVHKS